MMQYIIPAVSAVAVALVGALSTVEFGRRRKQARRAARHAQVRMEEVCLSMEMMSAAIGLSLAVAAVVQQHGANRDIETARCKAVKAREEYMQFLKQITSRQVAK